MKGRPAKTTVDYFPHQTASKKTIFTLESLYKNDGYAFWFKLLEILGSTENHCFCFEKTSDWLFLVARTGVDAEKAELILQTLVDLEAIDHELYLQKKIWSCNFVRGLLPVYDKRSTEIPSKPTLRGEKSIEREKIPQSKVEQSKGKYIAIATRLKDILLLRKSKNISKATLLDWSNTIRLLIEKDGVELINIQEALDWYEVHWDDNQYIPVIESAKALREKWDKLLNAIKRESSKSTSLGKSGEPTLKQQHAREVLEDAINEA